MTALLVGLTALLYSFQSLFCKLFSENFSKKNGAAVSTVFSLFFGVFTGMATLIISGFQLSFSAVTLICGLSNALVLLIYNTSMIQASRCGSYSLQMLCMLYGAIIMPMVHEALFMHKPLGTLQLIAIAVMLISLVLMNLKGLSLKENSGKFLFWCILLFLSNGIYSILVNVQQSAMNGDQRNEMIILTFLGMAVFYAVLQLIRKPQELKEIFHVPGKPLIYLLICCISATAAVHLSLYVLVLVGNATVPFTINNGSGVVLATLYSMIFFKEKISWVQWIGIGMAIISILMLSL